LKLFKQCELAVEVHRIPQRERGGWSSHALKPWARWWTTTNVYKEYKIRSLA